MQRCEEALKVAAIYFRPRLTSGQRWGWLTRGPSAAGPRLRLHQKRLRRRPPPTGAPFERGAGGGGSGGAAAQQQHRRPRTRARRGSRPGWWRQAPTRHRPRRDQRTDAGLGGGDRRRRATDQARPANGRRPRRGAAARRHQPSRLEDRGSRQPRHAGSLPVIGSAAAFVLQGGRPRRRGVVLMVTVSVVPEIDHLLRMWRSALSGERAFVSLTALMSRFSSASAFSVADGTALTAASRKVPTMPGLAGAVRTRQRGDPRSPAAPAAESGLRLSIPRSRARDRLVPDRIGDGRRGGDARRNRADRAGDVAANVAGNGTDRAAHWTQSRCWSEH